MLRILEWLMIFNDVLSISVISKLWSYLLLKQLLICRSLLFIQLRKSFILTTIPITIAIIVGRILAYYETRSIRRFRNFLCRLTNYLFFLDRKLLLKLICGWSCVWIFFRGKLTWNRNFNVSVFLNKALKGRIVIYRSIINSLRLNHIIVVKLVFQATLLVIFTKRSNLLIILAILAHLIQRFHLISINFCNTRIT